MRIRRLVATLSLAAVVLALATTAGSLAAPSSTRARTSRAGARPAPQASTKPRAAAPRPTRHLVALVDAARRARVHFTDLRAALPVTTTSEVILSLPGGLLMGHSTTDLGRRLADWCGTAQVDMLPERITARTEARCRALPEGSAVDAVVESRQDGGRLRSSGRLSADLPLDLAGLPLSRVALKGRSRHTYQQGSGTFQLSLAGGMVLSTEVPQRVDVDLRQVADGLEVSVVLVVSERHWAADSLKWMAEHPEKGSETLKESAERARVDLKGVRVSAVPGPAGCTGVQVRMVASGLGQALKDSLLPILGMLNSRDGGRERCKEALEQLTSLQVERFHLALTRQDDRLEVTCEQRVSGLDSFVVGYLALYAEMAEALQDFEAQYRGAGPESPWRALRLQVAARQVRLLASAFAKVRGSAEVSTWEGSLELTQGGGHLKAAGNLLCDVDMRAVVEAMKKEGFPVIERQEMRLVANTQGRDLRAQLSLDLGGNWVEALKRQYLDVAQGIEGLKPVAVLLSSMQLRGGRLVARLVDGKVEAGGYLQTSDAAALGRELTQRLLPSTPGQLVGAEIRFIQRGGARLSRTVDVYLQDVPSDSTALTKALVRFLRAGSCELRPVHRDTDVTLPALAAPALPALPMP